MYTSSLLYILPLDHYSLTQFSYDQNGASFWVFSFFTSCGRDVLHWPNTPTNASIFWAEGSACHSWYRHVLMLQHQLRVLDNEQMGVISCEAHSPSAYLFGRAEDLVQIKAKIWHLECRQLLQLSSQLKKRARGTSMLACCMELLERHRHSQENWALLRKQLVGLSLRTLNPNIIDNRNPSPDSATRGIKDLR